MFQVYVQNHLDWQLSVLWAEITACWLFLATETLDEILWAWYLPISVLTKTFHSFVHTACIFWKILVFLHSSWNIFFFAQINMCIFVGNLRLNSNETYFLPASKGQTRFWRHLHWSFSWLLFCNSNLGRHGATNPHGGCPCRAKYWFNFCSMTFVVS